MMMKTLSMKKQQKTKFRSLDQHTLKNVCDSLCDRIEDIMDHFGLEYKMNSRFLSMKCPIHGGDNDGAINLYHVGDSYRGNWKCRTHGCESEFKASIIGFIRGILSHQKYHWQQHGDEMVSFQETIEYIKNNIGTDISKHKPQSSDKVDFITTSKILSTKITKSENTISRNTIQKSLDIPSTYFINRGFSKDILVKYDIGECHKYGKEMYKRAVVPIYDTDYKEMVGCSGRSIFEKCHNCKCYHDQNNTCPDEENRWKYSKWKHSAGFKTQESLYNFWFAKEHIAESGVAILVESPGNVWRLEENGLHNSLALFGSNITDKQKMLLDISGAMRLILILDNDDAGNKAREVIRKKCDRTYNISDIYITKNDIAEMSDEEIQSQIKDLI